MKVHKKKFLYDYYEASLTKIDLIYKYGFKNYNHINKYLSEIDLSKIFNCKVCNCEITVEDRDYYAFLEYGTCCEDHLGYEVCPNCNRYWMNTNSNIHCNECNILDNTCVPIKKEIVDSQSKQMYDAFYPIANLGHVRILDYAYNNPNLTLEDQINYHKSNYFNDDEAEENYEYLEFENDIRYGFIFEERLKDLFEYNILMEIDHKLYISPFIKELYDTNKVHLLYSGKNSKEEYVFRLIKMNFHNIWIERQKTFGWLGKQRIDFYFPEYSKAVEWHGEQHYYPIEKFGGQKGYETCVKRDNRKRKLCRANKIPLLELKYDTSDEDILDSVADFLSIYRVTDF